MNRIAAFLFGSTPPQYESLWAYTNRVGLLTWQKKWPTYALFSTIFVISTIAARENNKQISITRSIVALSMMVGLMHLVEYSLDAQPCNKVKSNVDVRYNGALPVSINITREAVYIPEADEQKATDENKQ